MASILNNVGALGATRRLLATGMGLERSLQRLTSGRRLNDAVDDAAGLAISTSLATATRIAIQGRRNAHDAISYLQVADGALDELTRMLSRAAELTQQARTGTLSTGNRAALDAEFQSIQTSMNAVLTQTRFNGATVFVADATPTTQTGAGSYAAHLAGNWITLTHPLSEPTRNGWDLLAAVTQDVMGLPSTADDPQWLDLLAGLQKAAASACIAALKNSPPSLTADGTSTTAVSASDGTRPALGSGGLAVAAEEAVRAADTLLGAYPGDQNVLSLWLMATSLQARPPAVGAPDYQSAVNTADAASGKRLLTTTGASLVQAVGGYAPVTLNTDPSALPTALGAITTAAGAAAAQTLVDGALDAVSSLRATLGASTQQLSSVANALGLQVEGFTRSGSQIRDADLADEVVNLTRFQLLSRAGNAALAQANDAARSLLLLFAQGPGPGAMPKSRGFSAGPGAA